jgi:hypothetical protein
VQGNQTIKFFHVRERVVASQTDDVPKTELHRALVKAVKDVVLTAAETSNRMVIAKAFNNIVLTGIRSCYDYCHGMAKRPKSEQYMFK